LYQNPWVYNNLPFTTEDILDYIGFVYCITNTTNNKKYFGRKYFYQYRTPKGKKRKVKSESNWKDYYGSCSELKEDVAKLGKDFFKREILSLHKTEKHTNYEETRILFLHNVLTEKFEDGTEMYYNRNIMNNYYKKDYFGDESI
jgi:hypothetical protein